MKPPFRSLLSRRLHARIFGSQASSGRGLVQRPRRLAFTGLIMITTAILLSACGSPMGTADSTPTGRTMMSPPDSSPAQQVSIGPDCLGLSAGAVSSITAIPVERVDYEPDAGVDGATSCEFETAAGASEYQIIVVMTMPTDSYGIGSYLGECPLVQPSDEDSLSGLGREARWCESTSDVRWRTGGTTVMVRALSSEQTSRMAAASSLAAEVFPLIDAGDPEPIKVGEPSPMPTTVQGSAWCEQYWTLQTAYWPDRAAVEGQLDRVIEVADGEGKGDVADVMKQVKQLIGAATEFLDSPTATVDPDDSPRISTDDVDRLFARDCGGFTFQEQYLGTNIETGEY